LLGRKQHCHNAGKTFALIANALRITKLSRNRNPFDTTMNIAEIRDDFAFLDDWEDKYRYVIELGKSLPEMPEAVKTEANKVRGCASQVWLQTTRTDGSLHFTGDSDAMIVRGLVAILLAIYQDRTPKEILETDAREVFRDLGLKDHLTPQRSNGFASMVDRIQSDAHAALAAS